MNVYYYDEFAELVRDSLYVAQYFIENAFDVHLKLGSAKIKRHNKVTLQG